MLVIIGSRSEVVAAAVDELVDVDVVDDIIGVVVGRQVGQHQLVLVKVVHHCPAQNNAKQSTTAKLHKFIKQQHLLNTWFLLLC